MTKVYGQCHITACSPSEWSTMKEREVGIDCVEYEATLTDMNQLPPRECKHQPIEMVITPASGHYRVHYADEVECKHCKKMIKAKWELME